MNDTRHPYLQKMPIWHLKPRLSLLMSPITGGEVPLVWYQRLVDRKRSRMRFYLVSHLPKQPFMTSPAVRQAERWFT
jgi:hypothetical protein